MTGAQLACLAVGVSGLGIVVGALVTARRPASAVPVRDEYFVQWQQLHAGYDPRSNPFVRTVLGIAHALSAPLARRGVAPDAVTYAGLWLAAATACGAYAGGREAAVVALLLVVASGVVDTVDGCVAVLSGRTSQWGFVLDSGCDRVADALLLIALVGFGAHLEWAVAAGFALLLLEYVRARAGAGGVELAVATMGERPTRVVLVAATFLTIAVFVDRAADIATAGAISLLAVCTLGLVQLVTALRTQLRAS